MKGAVRKRITPFRLAQRRFALHNGAVPGPPTFLAALRDARTIPTLGPRLIDELECATSVALAIVLAHFIGAQHISWAAFSGYAVMRGHVRQTLVRGLLRIVGTVLGAGLALLLVPPLIAGAAVPIVALFAGVIGAAALYGAIVGKRAYAWLFFGLTFEMILLDALEHPDIVPRAFAATRLLEVSAGTAACVIVSLLSTLTLRRIWPAPPPPALGRMRWHPHAARHAAQAGVAVAILPFLWSLFAIPELAQSAITILATMLVPLTSIGASGFPQISHRLLQRVMGCVAGAALAAVVLFVADGSPIILILGTLNGVILGRHLENGNSSVAYVGTQFVLAILVTLVPDSYARADIAPALDRLMGIGIGILLLEPVLLAWHLFWRRTGITAPAETPSMRE